MPNINIRKQTKETLDKLKGTGQSYNGFITELFTLWMDVKLNKKVTVKLDR